MPLITQKVIKLVIEAIYLGVVTHLPIYRTSASQATALWRYRSFIIIIIITVLAR